MKYYKSFLIFFSLLIISSYCINEAEEIKKSYKKMFRLMQELNNDSSSSIDDHKRLSNEIYYFTMIGLVFILYFSVMALLNMNIQKSSILYAKYGTSKSQIE
jgi:dolichol kinase